ncbi:MAG: NAD(+)/NADH kinase [Planctomycetes bacterium]|nr:NAD(+)/NADH kinase [Planctomycetota bacterium]
MPRVLIVGDERKGRVREVLGAVVDVLQRRGVEHEVELDREAPLAGREADLVVVLGGDGSILAAARRMGPDQRPTLGINIGRLGFLTAFGDDRAAEGVEMALDGKLVEEPRLMLTCVVERSNGGSDDSVLFLNDVVLSAKPGAGIVRLIAARVDRELGAYSGDGLIVSTPVGSTAYSLAAGGPILSPRLEAVVLTPLAPHSISVRPLVLPVGDGFELRVEDAGNCDKCSLMIDGQVAKDVSPEDVVRIETTETRFRQLTHGPANFFAVLREKFGWSDEPRRRH